MRKFVCATGHLAGFHCWPEAPAEVDFLRPLHRHLFHWRVEVEVIKDDREVEFFILKAACASVLAELGTIRKDSMQLLQGVDFGAQSCEMLATKLGTVLKKTGLNVRTVVVGEDDENEARVEFD